MASFLDKDTGLPYFWSKLKALFYSLDDAKVDKPRSFTNGNLAEIDVDGNIRDSGKKTGDFKPINEHDLWTDVGAKPFETIGTALSVSNNALNNAGVRAAYLSSSDGVVPGSSPSIYSHYQTFERNTNGSVQNYSIEGTKYLEIRGTSATTTYIFTDPNGAFTSSNLVIRDICTNVWGEVPTNVVVDSTAGTCTITFATSVVRTVRIYYDY